ncbi:MAG: DUF3127 domain-containing protein [Bacteroidales bacterium]|nr:DUF3127 domain-containing protein [Bacteroidales bacterium]MDY5999926.1 DUF3127 domain-containing protein [Candidatus Limisoma sp.]
MEVVGKIILKLPLQSGVSQAGNNWKKQEYVLETEDSYPKKVHFDFFGDKADQFPLNVGDRVRLSFDIESREYNGRWYTSIRGWKAEAAAAAAAAEGPQQGPAVAAAAPAGAPVPPPPAFNTPEASDDLPF